jgi:adenylosuccinate lyase
VIDTAQALQMRDACDSSSGPRRLMQAVRTRARRTSPDADDRRTHGVHAEPMTFGL